MARLARTGGRVHRGVTRPEDAERRRRRSTTTTTTIPKRRGGSVEEKRRRRERKVREGRMLTQDDL